jgi:uncharacterized protein (TIGR03382 family)
MIRRVAATVALMALAAPAPALGFVIYDTGPGAKPGCDLPQPRKLRWEAATIRYVYDAASVENLPVDATEDVIVRSFDTWGAVECLADGHALVYDGRTAGATVGFDPSSPNDNENAVLFVNDGWSHGPGILGLTTLTYDTCSGVIVDADIEMNSGGFSFSVSDVPSFGKTDLANTVTHEAGHFLGLDHSFEPDATMYAKAPAGETSKRDLLPDDEEGLCAIYAGGELPTTDTTTGGSSSGTGRSGCSGAGGAGSAWTAALLVALAALVRRRFLF